MRMAMGKRIRMADSGLSPARKTVKMMSQVAMEFREAKKPFAVERRPMTARAMEARPMKGERKALSKVVFQAKNGMKATWILLMKVPQVRPGARKSSARMLGLTTKPTTKDVKPSKMMKIVRMRGMVGRVLIVKRRCGCMMAKATMKAAR